MAWADLAAWSWPPGADPTARYRGAGGRGGAAAGGGAADITAMALPALPARCLPPLPFQPAVVAAMTRGHYLNGCDTGTGKTAMALFAYELLRLAGKATAMAVVCPKGKIQDWRDDFVRFLGRPPGPQELTVFNYDRTFGRPKKDGTCEPPPEAADLLLRMRRIKHVLVLDEVHQGTGPKRFAGCGLLAAQAAYVWGLSGTLMRNRWESFFPVYILVTRANVALVDLIARYCHTERGAVTGYRTAKINAELRPIFALTGTALRKEDVLTDLPPVRLIPVRVRLEGEQKRLYCEFQKECRAVLKAEGGQERLLKATDRLPMITRLLQIASHPGQLGHHVDEKTMTKWQALEEILAAAGEQKVLVWDEHPFVLDRVAAAWPALRPAVMHGARSAKENEADKRRFLTDPTCRLLCISLLAFGEGLNLQAGSIAVFYGLTWRYDKFRQAMGRIHRAGQARLCTMYFLIGAGTLDELVFQAVQEKHRMDGSLFGGGGEWRWEPDRAAWQDYLTRKV